MYVYDGIYATLYLVITPLYATVKVLHHQNMQNVTHTFGSSGNDRQ